MLGGRLGDLFGHRRLFLVGLTIFTLASLVCGLSNSQWMLIAARAIQGIGGAIVSAVSLSLMVTLFTDPRERAKAMGYFGFVAAGGGSVGVLLGGVLVNMLDWHWIFLVNIPIGAIVFFMSLALLPKAHTPPDTTHLDILGALTITASLMLAVYAIVNGNAMGWLSVQTLTLLGVAIVLLIGFAFIESKAKSPLIPLDLFKLANLRTANIIGVLWAAAMFAWFFLSALFLQQVLEYRPLQVGLAFLPANLIMAAFSFSLSAKLIERFGIKRPLAVGLLLAGTGLLLFSFMPIESHFWIHVFPGMVLLGIGAGIAFNPVLLAAMNDVAPEESGIASGIVNTSFMMGGALGLAILASVAAARTEYAFAHHYAQLQGLASGYHLAFLIGAGAAYLAALLSATLLKEKSRTN
jgi:EmrB/QacA subfamily drug resistance transporter